jgi:hypothetical protein
MEPEQGFYTITEGVVMIGKMYVVPNKLLPVVEGMYRTFLEDCPKDTRIEVHKEPPNISWFLVGDLKEKEDGIIRVSGAIGPVAFKLYINPISACFEMDRDTPAALDQVFYVFIQVAANYRNMRRLPPLNKHIIDGLAVEDSPPVNAENYVELPMEGDIKKLGKLISENFTGVSFNECNGVLCYYICCALSDDPTPRKRNVQADVNFLNKLSSMRGLNGRSMPPGQIQAIMGIRDSLGDSFPSGSQHIYMPWEYVPVYTELLNSFRAAFPSAKAKLFAVRWKTKQRLFFVTLQGGIYCCKTDGSREFLEEHFDIVFRTLSMSRFKPAKTPSGFNVRKPQ